jgi:hypothetical protein
LERNSTVSASFSSAFFMVLRSVVSSMIPYRTNTARRVPSSSTNRRSFLAAALLQQTRPGGIKITGRARLIGVEGPRGFLQVFLNVLLLLSNKDVLNKYA